VKSSVLRPALGGLCILTMLLSFGGCENHEGNDWNRLVVDVQSVNDGNPLVSAYLTTQSSESFQTIDTVPVVFHARPYGMTITLPEDGAYSWFQITHYDLLWENVAGVPVDLTVHNVIGGSANAMVPVYRDAMTTVMIVGADMKSAPWFVDLYTGALPMFQANARLVFYGHETGSDRIVAIATGLRVLFIDEIAEK
jgi:hypothetical protein